MDRLLCAFLLGLFACGDDTAPDDAGSDAADAGDADVSAPDEGVPDAGLPDTGVFDLGPAVTGCELLDAGGMDAGVGDRMDGAVDAGMDLGADAALDGGVGFEPPAPDDFPDLVGPGGPASEFSEDALLNRCASLDGGERDRDHHNTVIMLDGYLWMPWAHEGGVGGISVWEFDEPCAPEPVNTVVHEDMRETHAAGFAYLNGRRWMVTASMTGIMFWDISDPAAIEMVTDFSLPDVVYPDSYARVVMSTFWQAPYVYVGGSDNGVYIVDASDPENPMLVNQVTPTPSFRVGGVHAVGNLLAVFPSQGFSAQLLDIASPTMPRVIPGGILALTDGTTDRRGRPSPKAAYFAHLNGNRAYFAQHLLGGGLIIFDIRDFTLPTFLGNWDSPDFGANGGYVFVKEDEAFIGLSGHGEVIDIQDPANPSRLARVDMTGDLDTIVPVGNVMVASVDDDAVPGQASNVMPLRATPDRRAPRVNMVVPRDEEERVALGSRIGITFDEHIELQTLHTGSFYVRAIDDEGEAIAPPLRGLYSGQEGVYNFTPGTALQPNTRYEVVIPAGGVQDWSGNPTDAAFRSTFRTTSCE